jgi:hypothetical protein
MVPPFLLSRKGWREGGETEVSILATAFFYALCLGLAAHAGTGGSPIEFIYSV